MSTTTTVSPVPWRLTWLGLVTDALPGTINAIYEAKRRGGAPWLHHVDPFTGEPSRLWSIDPDGLAADFRRRGKRLNPKFLAAVVAKAVPADPAWFTTSMEAAQKS
jgi:hypothetical protein